MHPLKLKVVYLAMPLRAPTAEGREANRRRAAELSAYIAWTERVAVANTWPMLAEFWSEEQGREFGLKLDCAVISRCDELWLCGPRQDLSVGMQIEFQHAREQNVTTHDRRGYYDDVKFTPTKPLAEQYSGGRVELTGKITEDMFTDNTIGQVGKPYEASAAAHGEAIGNAVVDDAVNHPNHYTQHPSGVECISIIEHMTLNVGNAVKYLWRAGLKDNTPMVQDLEKARWYIDREISRLKAQKEKVREAYTRTAT